MKSSMRKLAVNSKQQPNDCDVFLVIFGIQNISSGFGTNFLLCDDARFIVTSIMSWELRLNRRLKKYSENSTIMTNNISTENSWLVTKVGMFVWKLSTIKLLFLNDCTLPSTPTTTVITFVLLCSFPTTQVSNEDVTDTRLISNKFYFWTVLSAEVKSAFEGWW